MQKIALLASFSQKNNTPEEAIALLLLLGVGVARLLLQ